MKLLILLLSLAFLPQCGAVKNVIHTSNDWVALACAAYIQGNTDQLRGLTPEQWCAIHENVAPLIDVLTSMDNNRGITRDE